VGGVLGRVVGKAGGVGGVDRERQGGLLVAHGGANFGRRGSRDDPGHLKVEKEGRGITSVGADREKGQDINLL